MQSDYTAFSRWPDPFASLRRAQDDLTSLFGGLRLGPAVEFPPMNIWASAHGVLVTAEVPGVAPEQFDISVHKDALVVQGKREAEAVEPDAQVRRQERPLGPFSRTVALPFRVDADKVSARFDRGVLTIDLPRPEADKPHQIKITRA